MEEEEIIKMQSMPQFEDQEVKLRRIVEERLAEMKETSEAYSFTFESLKRQALKEYNIIVDQGIAGVYYMLATAFDKTQVHPSEVRTDGNANGSVMQNLLGFTGLAKHMLLEGILGADQRYYPELYYGPENARMNINPTTIRLSERVFLKVIIALEKMQSECLTPDYFNRNLSNHQECADVGLYLLKDDFLVKKEKNVDASMEVYDNPELIRLYCESKLDDTVPFPEAKEETERRNAFRREIFKNVNPKNMDDISFAAGLFLVASALRESMFSVSDDVLKAGGIDPKTKTRIKVFREEYMKDLIDGNHAKEFLEMKKLCLNNQVFSKAHLDVVTLYGMLD